MKNSRWACVDTNVILRVIINDGSGQRERFLDLIAAGKYFFVPDMAIYEAVYVMSSKRYNFKRERIIESLRDFLSEPRFDYNKPVFDLVFEEFPKHPKLSFADCYMCAVAKAHEMEPLWTFDRKLANQCDMAREVPVKNIS